MIQFQVQDKRFEYFPEDGRDVCKNQTQDRQKARVRSGGGKWWCHVGEWMKRQAVFVLGHIVML